MGLEFNCIKKVFEYFILGLVLLNVKDNSVNFRMVLLLGKIVFRNFISDLVNLSFVIDFIFNLVK
jgi:hypothetical protein